MHISLYFIVVCQVLLSSTRSLAVGTQPDKSEDLSKSEGQVETQKANVIAPESKAKLNTTDSPASVNDGSTHVVLDYGDFMGKKEDTVESWYGVPYVRLFLSCFLEASHVVLTQSLTRDFLSWYGIV